jgi:PncC family amidohydrolase
MTAVPGSSAWFVGGVIAYANEVKQGLLAVREETLRAHGAVSEPTVIEMADGARRATGAEWGIAITGIAGPDGGTPEKPVGTVFIAITAEGVRQVRELHWPAEREQVRLVSAYQALHLLYKLLA